MQIDGVDQCTGLCRRRSGGPPRQANHTSLPLMGGQGGGNYEEDSPGQGASRAFTEAPW